MTTRPDALDVTDPDIRAMAQRNHRPEEMWTVAGALICVCCDACKQPWPCATKRALERVT